MQGSTRQAVVAVKSFYFLASLGSQAFIWFATKKGIKNMSQDSKVHVAVKSFYFLASLG